MSDRIARSQIRYRNFLIWDHPARTVWKPTDLTETVELGGIYSIPGEGFVAELLIQGGKYLFDRQGLMYRIIEKKKLSLDTEVEEVALARINNLGPVFG